MTTRAFWLAVFALICTFTQVHAWQIKGVTQWPRTLNRGAIAHTIFNPGMSGREENGLIQSPSSFSYPAGRALRAYSGGPERDGWNAKSASAGEGFWVMSKTGGVARVTTAGSMTLSSDLTGVSHTPKAYPEAYLGAVEHPEYALISHNWNFLQSAPAEGVDNLLLLFPGPSYWPGSGPVGSPVDASPLATESRRPMIIWNHRFQKYPSATPYAERIAAGEFQKLGAPAWAEALSEDDFPEVVGLQRGKSTQQNLEWMRRWFQWGSADDDDFLIVENVVTNTGNKRAEGVYVVLQNRFTSGMSHAWFEGADRYMALRLSRLPADNFIRSTVAANYLQGGAFLGGEKPAGAPAGKALAEQGHALVYLHDGDSADLALQHNDWGDPYISDLAYSRFNREQLWANNGMLQHAAYFGLGVIDALPPFNTYGGADLETYVPPRDNPDTDLDESRSQPASIAMWQMTDIGSFAHPHPRNNSDDEIYRVLSSSGHMEEPDFPEEWTQFMTFGPYDLEPGEKFKVVVAYVGGMASQQPKYADYKQYAKPFDFAWMNLYNGPGRSRVQMAERQAELSEGETAMFNHFQRAIDVYNWGYDIPNQPPNIKLAHQSDPEGRVEVSWSSFGEDASDPDYEGAEARDLRGYRIYKSRTENQGPFELVAEFSFDDARAGKLPSGVRYDPNLAWRTTKSANFPEGIPLRESPLFSGLDSKVGREVSGRYAFVDADSKPGFPNWYSVRYYDSGHANWKGVGKAIPALESAPGPDGGAVIGQPSGITPVLPGSAVFDRLEKQVQVVPNPFKLGDNMHTYGGTEEIRFTNLPGRCRLDIFDTTGQRVWTQFKDDLITGELIWYQRTFNRSTNWGQTVYSGIYFWKVTSLMPESEGKTQSGTFVVIK